MDPILLCIRPGNYQATTTEPIKFKTPAGAYFFGFSRQGIGIHYLRRIGFAGEKYDLISLGSLDAETRHKVLGEAGIVIFREEEDLDLYFKDREDFPYKEYEVPVLDIIRDSGLSEGASMFAGVRANRWEMPRRRAVSIIAAFVSFVSLLRLIDLSKQNSFFLTEIIGEIVVSCIFLLIAVHFWRPKERL